MKNIVFLAFLSCASAFVYADFVNPEDVKKAWEVEQQKKKDDYIASLKGKELWLNKKCSAYEYGESFKIFSEIPTGNNIQDEKISFYLPKEDYEKILIEDISLKKQGDRKYYNEREKYVYRVKISTGQEAYILSESYLNIFDFDKSYFSDLSEFCWSEINPVEYIKQQEEIAAASRKLQEIQDSKPGVRIGMTKKQVLTKTSWGKPDEVNKSTDRTGTFEQWIYGGGNYLYFKNGILVSIQN